MTRPTTHALAGQAQQAGYHVVSAEQLRPNRWLLHLLDGDGAMLVLVQARPLVGAADVQDLAEVVRLRGPRYGILLAYEGAFSPAAQRTLAELGDHRLRLCTALPPASRASSPEPRTVPITAKPLP
ncbi:MAG TPA: hypothetical protein VNL77_16655 [Roseiflexaceae bacterium]|nr:hypothetical protein [Roseiflexaceae bacterium]